MDRQFSGVSAERSITSASRTGWRPSGFCAKPAVVIRKSRIRMSLKRSARRIENVRLPARLLLENPFDARADAAQNAIGNRARELGDLLRIDRFAAVGSEQRNGVAHAQATAIRDVYCRYVHRHRAQQRSDPAAG